MEQIDGPTLAKSLREPAPPIVLDVRTPGEFRQGHIPGARLVPLGQLGAHLGTLPKDGVIVTVCRSGHRSMAAAQQLMRAGFTVRSLTGGMMLWGGKTARA